MQLSFQICFLDKVVQMQEIPKIAVLTSLGDKPASDNSLIISGIRPNNGREEIHTPLIAEYTDDFRNSMEQLLGKQSTWAE